jgi:hypothetical protein
MAYISLDFDDQDESAVKKDQLKRSDISGLFLILH